MENYLITEVAERLKDLEVYNETFKEHHDFYQIELLLDLNDADYKMVRLEVGRQKFENDLTLKLALSYLLSYGDHVYDKYGFNVPGIYDYLGDKGLMAYSESGPAHSVCEVKVIFIDATGNTYSYVLPDFRTLFPEQSDGFEVLNYLLGQDGKEEREKKSAKP